MDIGLEGLDEGALLPYVFFKDTVQGDRCSLALLFIDYDFVIPYAMLHILPHLQLLRSNRTYSEKSSRVEKPKFDHYMDNLYIQ